jgi:methyl-accepting chemotaxis protein
MLDVKNMKVATKLTLGFGLIVVLMIVSGGLAYLALQATVNRTHDIVNDKVPKMQMASQINYHVLDIARNLRNALLEAENPEKMETQIKRVLESRAKIKEVVEQLKPKVVLPEGKAILGRILEARTAFIEGQDTVIRLLREKKANEAREYLLTEMRKRQAVYAEATNELQALQEKLMKTTATAAEEEAAQAIMLIIVALIVSAAISALIAWLIVRDLVAQLGGEPAEAAAEVGRIAAGDLSSSITLRPGDSSSLLASLKTMQMGLATLVGEIRQMVDAAAQGNFSTRIEISNKQGFGRDIGEALNLLADTTDTGLNDVMRVSQALSVGDLNQRIEKSYPGVFGRTGTAVNATVDALKIIVADIDSIVQAANQGDFSVRVELSGKQGFGRELSELLNQLSATTEAGLQDIMRVAGTLAQGDLTQTIEKDYPGLFGETRAGINATVANLTTLIGQLKDSVSLINTAASEIAAGNQDLSSRTEEQASSLEETASSMEELTSTVKENTEGANSANRDAKAAADVAARGGVTVKGSVATMEEISASSKKIADIVGVIDSIAFQTNILALNAAVEAARAGEQGRGFAVVATEVRNLAKRSGDAAREIKDLIGDTLTRIDNGAAQANLAGSQMDEIVSAIASVSRVISDIASAGVEQSTGIEQVTQAVSQMDEVTQQNAALVEQAAAAAESLREQAEQLSQAIGQFKLAGGNNSVAVTQSPRRLPPPLKTGAKINSPVRSLGKPIPPPAAHAGTNNDEWAEF